MGAWRNDMHCFHCKTCTQAKCYAVGAQNIHTARNSTENSPTLPLWSRHSSVSRYMGVYAHLCRVIFTAEQPPPADFLPGHVGAKTPHSMHYFYSLQCLDYTRVYCTNISNETQENHLNVRGKFKIILLTTCKNSHRVMSRLRIGITSVFDQPDNVLSFCMLFYNNYNIVKCFLSLDFQSSVVGFSQGHRNLRHISLTQS